MAVLSGLLVLDPNQDQLVNVPIGITPLRATLIARRSPFSVRGNGQWKIGLYVDSVEIGSVIVDPTTIDETQTINIPLKQKAIVPGSILQAVKTTVGGPVPALSSITITLWYKFTFF